MYYTHIGLMYYSLIVACSVFSYLEYDIVLHDRSIYIIV